MRHDARLACEHSPAKLSVVVTDALGIPVNLERGVVAAVVRHDNPGGHAGHLFDTLFDLLKPAEPFAVFRSAVAAGEECFGRNHEAHNLLLAHFYRAAEGDVRRTHLVSCANEIGAAEKNARGLRSAEDLAAAVGNQVNSGGEVRIRL